jgi:hypothetical protein
MIGIVRAAEHEIGNKNSHVQFDEFTKFNQLFQSSYDCEIFEGVFNAGFEEQL